MPQSALKISQCNLRLFFIILDWVLTCRSETAKAMGVQVSKLPDEILEQICAEIDFKRVFNYLFETMRGLLIYAKEGDFDKIFVEEGLVQLLAQVIKKCYCEHSDLIIRLTSDVVNKKLIANDDKMFDLMNYAIGTIKCFT